MRVLLTGASGNIGQGVLRALIARGHHVLAVARDRQRLDDACRPYGPKAVPFACDLSAGLPETFPDDYDAVIHAAAHATAADSPDAHVAHNLVALRHLIAHATRRPGRVFIFLSSLSVYGTISDPIVDEHTAVCDPGSYGASKLLGEMLLRECGTRLSSIALRLPGIIGPGAHAPWLARTLAEARARRKVAIYSPQTPFNNAVHVADLGAFVTSLLSRVPPGFDVLTLGAGEPKPLREVIAAMLAELDHPTAVEEIDPPRAPFVLSIKKAVRNYGFAPPGILETVRRFAVDSDTSYFFSPPPSNPS